MDAKTWLGSLSEIKVIARLIEEGYDVFNQLSGKSPFDLVAYKENKLYRISVKGTATTSDSGSYVVQLKSVRSNRTNNNIINFDNTSCDILAVYIEPEDRVILYNSVDILFKSAMSIKPFKKEII